MTTIKSYTDIEQSKVLAKILPLESADMTYICIDICKGLKYMSEPRFIKNIPDHADEYDIPCWSLAALLEQLPYEICDDDGNSSYLQINKEDDVYQLVYEDPYGDFESIETDRYEHFINACYEMILKLHELEIL